MVMRELLWRRELGYPGAQTLEALKSDHFQASTVGHPGPELQTRHPHPSPSPSGSFSVAVAASRLIRVRGSARDVVPTSRESSAFVSRVNLPKRH